MPTQLGSSCSTPQRLPDEILDLISRCLGNSDLYVTLRACKRLYGICARILYRDLEPRSLKESILVLLTLSKNRELAEMVRILTIDWSVGRGPSEGGLYRNGYKLLHAALRRLTKLRELCLETPKTHDVLWILLGCTFKLSSLSLSFQCNRRLADYLCTQPGLTELALRGLNEEKAIQTTGQSDYTTFILPSTALPNLQTLRIIHTTPETLCSLISHRSIRELSIPLYPMNSLQTLNALSASSRHLERLNIISFDRQATDYLVQELAARPRVAEHLIALHLVMLLTRCTQQKLLDFTPSWGEFKKLEASFPSKPHFNSVLTMRWLQYLTYISAMSSDAPKDSTESTAVENERSIAVAWHEACPTLRTLILPQGKVWFNDTQHDNGWICSEDDKLPSDTEHSV